MVSIRDLNIVILNKFRMMPRTHVMIGALVGALLSFKFNIAFTDVIIAAIFGSFVDLDHVVSHWQKSGRLSISDTLRVDVKGLEHSRTPWIHGKYGLITMA